MLKLTDQYYVDLILTSSRVCTGYEDPQVVGNLAMAVMRACSAQMRLGQHFLGVGLHDDRVYMHVKVRVHQVYMYVEVCSQGTVMCNETE